MTDLRHQHCEAPEGFAGPLSPHQVESLVAELHADWRINPDSGTLTRTFEFSDYYETMSFVNAVAWIAHGEDHHPDLEVGYNRCRVHFVTHAVGGLSPNDFICAARVDALFD